MKTSTKLVLFTVILGIVALPLGQVIWPPSSDFVITKGQFPFFVFLGIIEALFFGFGVGFLFVGWPYIKNKRVNKAMFVSICWLLISWWPHDRLHAFNGMNTQGLLYIDYGFHFTIIIASFILALGFLKIMKEGR